MGARIRRTAVCVCCNEIGQHRARGLIRDCYERNRVAGTLEQWPRHTRVAEEIVPKIEALRAANLTWPEVAREMGYAHGWSAESSYRFARQTLARRESK